MHLERSDCIYNIYTVYILIFNLLIINIAFFEDGHVFILCMNKDMATRLLHAQYFQVDLTFKRVHGKINEFEFNEFDSNHNIS